MKIYDVIIIGGGASGLMCANYLNKDFNALIIDKHDLGKKLLVTGNGRCNFSNQNLDISKYNNEKIEGVINSFDSRQLREFFRHKGVESYADAEGRVYPLSNTAKDVKTALTRDLKFDFIKEEVVKLVKNKYFNVQLSDGEIVSSKKVVYACGNKNMNKILEEFNFKTEENKCVLTGFKIKQFDKKLFGLRQDCIVKAQVEGRSFEEAGQVQFRKDGLSGIVIFNLSAFLHKHGKLPIKITLSLLPNIDENMLRDIMEFRRANCDFEIKDALFSLVNPQLADYIIKCTKIKTINNHISTLTNRDIDKIIHSLKNLEFVSNETYDEAQVISGGIDFSALKNFQAENGLYFCGEACNIFGPCGGYNLQWAFSSGVKVAQYINNDLINR